MDRRAPDATGPTGKAWAISIEPASPVDPTPLTAWLVWCPAAHPFWKWWVVQVLELRRFPSNRRRDPKAEFEFIIYAIDPYACPEPDPEKAREGYPELIPFDIVEQFHGVPSDQAKHLCMTAVHAIVNGMISPDEDHVADWQRTIATMVEHIRSGSNGK